MKVIIMAGGKGSRIASVSGEKPKSLLKIGGKSILEHQIENLKASGFRDFTLVIGHLGKQIEKHLGDGSRLGIRVNYYREDSPLGTAGALVALKDELKEDFLLINGDILFDVDFKPFVDFHFKKKALASLFTHPNDHPFDSEIVVSDKNDLVTDWLKKDQNRYACKNRVNAGLHLLSPRVLDSFSQVKPLNLDRDLLRPLLDTGRVYAYNSIEYVKDMGTPQRYEEVKQDFFAGRLAQRRLGVKKRAIFLDRDGTLNIHKGFIKRAEDLELLPGAGDAVAKINRAGYLTVLITNQAVIARGDCSLEELERIHGRLECLLGQDGAFLDALYFCPHHPDAGFPGERPEYKFDCQCRKPKPGMLLEAADDLNIDLAASYMVGDSFRDVEAGLAAGCKTAYLSADGEAAGGLNTPVYKSLHDFVNKNIRP
ncbi:MAG: HAD-IIIA family hydrolase [Clostridiales bacterium]|nr:HAD-IIIA family hydrolase [Clostridiales bacterium]